MAHARQRKGNVARERVEYHHLVHVHLHLQGDRQRRSPAAPQQPGLALAGTVDALPDQRQRNGQRKVEFADAGRILLPIIGLIGCATSRHVGQALWASACAREVVRVKLQLSGPP